MKSFIQKSLYNVLAFASYNLRIPSGIHFNGPWRHKKLFGALAATV